MTQEELFYQMIFKRKSFHLFRNHKTKEYFSDTYKITESEINDIYSAFKTFKPLFQDINVEIRIVENELTTCKRGQEYCILFYSEKKPNYLQNIGALWFGIGKTEEMTYNGLWKSVRVNYWCIDIRSQENEELCQRTKLCIRI